ncbi:MAG TPA: hypothetical protein PLL39_15715, partial [Rhodocyclaceae bacterium]|nr:hypothetical protein [Rhodocyclaceae bacterium]
EKDPPRAQGLTALTIFDRPQGEAHHHSRQALHSQTQCISLGMVIVTRLWHGFIVACEGVGNRLSAS